MTAVDRERLRALADAATPGPWEAQLDAGLGWIVAAPEQRVDMAEVGFYEGADTDAAFIAAADPDTIRQLLDTLDRVEALAGKWAEPPWRLGDQAYAAELRAALAADKDTP